MDWIAGHRNTWREEVSDFDCRKCDGDCVGEDWSFGGQVKCVDCGTVYEVEWDYVDCYEGITSHWLGEEIKALEDTSNGGDDG